MQRNIEFLKKSLDYSYERFKDNYKNYSTMEEFYKAALTEMYNGNFNFIPNYYRQYLMNNFRSVLNYCYWYSTKNYARQLNKVPSIAEVINEVSYMLDDINNYNNIRHFNEQVTMLDNDLNSESINKRRELLESVVFDYKIPSKKMKEHKELEKYKYNKMELILLLTENTFRLYNSSKHRGPYVKLLHQNVPKKFDPVIIENADYNEKRVFDLMSKLNDVASFVNNASTYDIKEMIDLYVISHNNKKNIDIILNSSNIITDKETQDIFNQFMDKKILQKSRLGTKKR